MSVKAKVEAIIYATEEPVTLNQLTSLLREPVLAEIRAEEESRLALNEMLTDDEPVHADDSDDFLDELAVEAEAPSEAAPAASKPEADAEQSPAQSSADQPPREPEKEKEEARRIKAYLAQILEDLTADYAAASHGVEVRLVAGGYRMGTKPEHHDVVVGFAKSLKPPVRLSLQALETLAVIAYKQPVTVPEISEIRGVDASGVIATLLDRKLITTGGRKQVIGRPILYKTTKEFLMRFGLNNVAELPSMEEFEKLGDPQADLFEAVTAAPPDELANASPIDATPEASATSEVESIVEPDNQLG